MDDNPDSVRTLRPFDFLLESGEPGLPPIKDNEEEEWKPNLSAPEKLLTTYKNSLQRRQQRHKMKGNDIIPRIGEVVLLTDENTPRASWRLGRISELPLGDPTSIRSAKVLMPSGKILKRALAHLVPLEIGGGEESIPQSKETQIEPKKIEERTKIKRDAKEKALQKINANAYGLKAIPFLIICLQLIACANATNLRTPLLPYECEAEGQLLHTESNCNSKGILIYSKTGKDPPELCYKIKSCGEKFLTPVSGGWSCLDNCGKCPDWAAGCSHTNNYVIYEQAKLNNIASHEQIESDNDISILIPTIELFNGNIRYVQQLQIRTIDVFDKDEVCIGKGATIGTPHYCSIHDCLTSGTRFCYYPHRETTLFISKDVEIPIKAWGYKRIYINGTNKKAIKAEIVSSAAPETNQELEKWWVSKSAKGQPSAVQVKEYGPAANFKTRNEFIEDCKRKARKLPPLLRAVQSLQLAALESQKEAANVDPETGKITRAEKTTVAKSNEKEEEGRRPVKARRRSNEASTITSQPI
uniref:DUF5641 domain-containing protein n=1 Tax=Meloidogyne javanica TaxID=6303 RepID=A0A915MKG5_MELJA